MQAQFQVVQLYSDSKQAVMVYTLGSTIVKLKNINSAFLVQWSFHMFFSGSRNRQNGTIYGPRNRQYDQEILYPMMSYFLAVLSKKNPHLLDLKNCPNKPSIPINYFLVPPFLCLQILCPHYFRCQLQVDRGRWVK